MANDEGLDGVAVTRWMAERVELSPPLRFAVIHGGRSNLTYDVTDSNGRRWVLRRPPLHGVLESAHDVAREHRVVTALTGSGVPVPTCVGLETDVAVIGAPFYVMDHVPGEVVRDVAAAERHLTAATRAAAADDLIDVLARLHAVDPDEVGLGDLARREGYIERQLRRWHGQLAQARTRALPLLDEVHARLAADVPSQGGASIVHGDYRLDNLMLDPATGRVLAVLDWELTTLGDPLADLGLLLVYWSGPTDSGLMPLQDMPSRAAGFPDRDGLVERYAAVSGRDVSDVGYFVAFGRWKLACILEGVHGRYVSGAYGGSPDPGFEGLDVVVDVLAQQAAEAVSEVGR